MHLVRPSMLLRRHQGSRLKQGCTDEVADLAMVGMPLSML